MRPLQNIGVDGIELHAAHGYLISQFLNPGNNQRNDEYGGSPENCRRILQEIVSSIRSAVDKNFVVSAKVNVSDCVPRGVNPYDLAETIKSIKGMDFYEISCGFGVATSRTAGKFQDPNFPFQTGYNIEDMAIVHRRNPNMPLAVCGAMQSIKDMERAIGNGATLISFGRPSIADPRVVQHLQEGEKKVRCVFCSQCGHHVLEGPVHCHVYKNKH